MADREQLTEDEKEVRVRRLGTEGSRQGVRPTDEFLPAAESMESKGWLSSTTLKNGDVAYAFTAAGETALDMSELVRQRARPRRRRDDDRLERNAAVN